MKRTILFITAILITALFMTCITPPAFAADANDTSDDTSSQQNKYTDFDDWYKPDSAYQTNDQKQKPPENSVSPNGGVEEPRVAPLKDTRPKDR